MNILILILLAVFLGGLAGMILYFIFSKKSSPAVKKTAIGALILILLSVGISLFIIFSGPAVELVPSEFVQPDASAEPSSPVKYFIIFLLILAILVGIIIFFSVRDRNNPDKTEQKNKVQEKKQKEKW